jgi:hypothetical protein
MRTAIETGALLVAAATWALYIRLSDRDVLHAWTKEEGLVLLQWHTTFLLSYPFGYGSRYVSRSIYTIKVRDRLGRERNGWARISWDSSLHVRWRDDAA